MNYLAELIAFSEWKEVNPLPASAVALWYELMAVCNKTGWLPEFTVPNGLLQARAGLSRKEFDYARQLLISLGRIRYKKSERVNQAGKYSLLSFVQYGQQKGQQQGQHDGQRYAHGTGNETDTLFKHKQNLNNDDDNAGARDTEILKIYQQETGRLLGPIEIEQILSLVSDFGYDLTLESIRVAVSSGSLRLRYIETVLVNWRKNNLRTVAEVREYESRKKRGDEGGGGKRQTSRSDGEIAKAFDRSAFEYKADAL